MVKMQNKELTPILQTLTPKFLLPKEEYDKIRGFVGRESEKSKSDKDQANEY